MADNDLQFRTGQCPICGATDAFVEALHNSDEYYVECVNCRVYRASRRAFRLFQYLRTKADRDSLARLERLAAALGARNRDATARLEYDTWEEL